MIKFEVTVAEFLDRYKYRKKIEEHYHLKNLLRDLVLEPFYELQKGES